MPCCASHALNRLSNCEVAMTADIRLKWVYEPASDDDGLRILVDCLWPRGMNAAVLRDYLLHRVT